MDLPEEVTFDEYVNSHSNLQYSPMLSYEDMVRLNSTAVEGKDDTDDVGDSLPRVTDSRLEYVQPIKTSELTPSPIVMATATKFYSSWIW